MSSGAGQRLAGFRVEYTLLTLPPGTTIGATSCLDTPEDCCVGSSGSSGSGSGSLGCAAFDADWPDTLDLVVSGATNPDCNGTFTLTWDGWRYLLERSLVDPPDCVDLAQDPGPYTLTYLLEEWDGGIRFRMTLEGAVQVYGEAVAEDLAGTCCPAIDLVGSVDYPCCGLGSLDIGISGTCSGGSSGSSGSGSGGGGTVTVGCCGNAIPETLTATLSDITDCACAAGGSIPLTWNGTRWEGTGALGTCGANISIILECVGLDCSTGFQISVTSGDCAPGFSNVSPTTCVCDPFEVGVSVPVPGGCGSCATEFQLTITA